MSLTQAEQQELEALRKFKLQHDGKALNRAFARLETLLDSAHNPLISLRAFRIIGECLVCLKEEIDK